MANICRSASQNPDGDLRAGSARIALLFATVLSVVAPAMPAWKRKEVRDRILADEPIAPIFIELNTGAYSTELVEFPFHAAGTEKIDKKSD